MRRRALRFGVARQPGVQLFNASSTFAVSVYMLNFASLPSRTVQTCAKGEVIERACPLFVPLAEEGWADSDVARTVARDYLHDFTATPPVALVLGCTHYPILREVISETVGREVKLIDSGAATARDVESLLESSDLTHEDALGLYQERQLCDGLDHFYVTDAAERFAKVAERFLGSAPSILEAVEIWGHDELRTH